MPRILMIGAHNDESMADMGGTAYKLHKAGCELLFLNHACQWNDDTLPESEKERYRRQEEASARILGGDFMAIGNREDLLFLESKEAIEETARIILDYRPHIIFIHPPRDNHIEHRESGQVAYKAICAAHVRKAKIGEVYSFDTGIMQGMDFFRPDFFVDVAEEMEQVKESLMQFDQNFAKGETLWKNYQIKRLYRGRCAKVEYAEAFKIVKFPNGSDDLLLKKLLGDSFRWYGSGIYPAFGENYF